MEIRLSDYEEMQRIAQLLSNEHRIHVLSLLAEAPRTTAEMHDFLRTRVRSRDTVWRYLESLRRAGLVRRRYDEERRRWVYSLREESITFNLAA